MFQKIVDSLVDIGVDLLVIIAIIVVAKLGLNLISFLTGKAMKKAEKLNDEEKGKQIKTSMTVTHSANRYLVYIIVVFLCLKQIGLGDKVSNAIIAAGIGGLVLSLGTQSIVKDLVAGIILMFERQFYVGDYVKINNYEGTVSSIAIRVTYLVCGGKRVIIPNGQINEVINYSRVNSIASIVIPVSYDNDPNKVIKIVNELIKKFYKANKSVLIGEMPVVDGVSSFEDYCYKLSFGFTTKPLKHFKVEKDFRLLLLNEFKKKKIKMPTNTRR